MYFVLCCVVCYVLRGTCRVVCVALCASYSLFPVFCLPGVCIVCCLVWYGMVSVEGFGYEWIVSTA